MWSLAVEGVDGLDVGMLAGVSPNKTLTVLTKEKVVCDSTKLATCNQSQQSSVTKNCFNKNVSHMFSMLILPFYK